MELKMDDDNYGWSKHTNFKPVSTNSRILLRKTWVGGLYELNHSLNHIMLNVSSLLHWHQNTMNNTVSKMQQKVNKTKMGIIGWETV